MGGVETWQEARRVLYAGDGPVALAVARRLGLDGPLQKVGDLVLLALDHDASTAAEFAEQCSGASRVRGRHGDQELADAIDAARGMAPSGVMSLAELAVDLEQLADLIDAGADSAGGRLDLTTGEVWPEFAFQDSIDEDADDDEPDRWLHVWPTGSGAPTTTWSTSPPHGRTSGSKTDWIARWTAAPRSVDSRTR